MNVLVILLSLIFFALGTAKILALRPMRERAAEAGFWERLRDVLPLAVTMTPHGPASWRSGGQSTYR
jgi:hypothetical protein